MDKDMSNQPIALADPVPWFSARSITGGSIELQINAGRWIVLAFLGSLNEPRARRRT